MNSITFDDAVIFLGMKYAGHETEAYYVNLVGCIDDIGQHIPGYDGFISAYNKLLYISAIKNENGKICIMEFGNSIYHQALSKSTSGASPEDIAKLIHLELKPYKLKSVCRQSPLAIQEYDAAIKLYKAKKLSSI